MKKIVFYFLAGLLTLSIFSCDSTPKFTVDGTITDAENKTIHLEALDINGTISLDSMKLDKEGKYKFSGQCPESPEFYRLRIDNKTISFSVDSTEIITIDAPYSQFTTLYTVKGSENSDKIKELTLLQIKLQQRIDALTEFARNSKMQNIVFEDSLSTLLNDYKEKIKREYIYVAPGKSYAYFALFQRINNYLIFDPLSNKDDIKAFAAVATSLNSFYPHSDRSRNLYNMVIKGMKNTRPQQQAATNIPEINEATIIDIDLKDMKGISYKLTGLKGKVVLLDFTVYKNAMSSSHNFALRDLYDKFADKGLEIYQVSLDSDEHFWKTVAENLPWICVRDPNGIYSTIAATYNIQQLPTYFLVTRKNELYARDESIKNLENEIKKLL